MFRMLTIWTSLLTTATAGGYWYTYSRKNIPYVNEEKVIVREGNHRVPYFSGPGFYRRSPTGGGPGHGK